MSEIFPPHQFYNQHKESQRPPSKDKTTYRQQKLSNMLLRNSMTRNAAVAVAGNNNFRLRTSSLKNIHKNATQRKHAL